MMTGNLGTKATSCESPVNRDESDWNDLADIARTCLQTSAHRALRFLKCECGQGILILRGRVSSYYDKQLAQESVRHLPGLKALVNVIEVDGPRPRCRNSENRTIPGRS